MKKQNTLHIFLDESGNFDFTSNGTKYFVLTALSCREPFLWIPKLELLKEEICQTAPEYERFHASRDLQANRDRFFKVVAPHFNAFRVDSVVVEKRKTYPPLRPPAKLYPKMMEYLLKYTLNGHPRDSYSKIEITTDRLPLNQKKGAVTGAIKSIIHNIVGRDCPFEISHKDSRQCFNLQTVDYMSWAIYRKWEKPCDLSYKIVRPCIYSEFDIFRIGTKLHY